jgi:hypothetical protein
MLIIVAGLVIAMSHPRWDPRGTNGGASLLVMGALTLGILSWALRVTRILQRTMRFRILHALLFTTIVALLILFAKWNSVITTGVVMAVVCILMCMGVPASFDDTQRTTVSRLRTLIEFVGGCVVFAHVIRTICLAS